METAHSSRLRRSAQLLVLVALLLGLSGCARFVYTRLDTLAIWYFDGLVSLDSDQRTDLRSWLQQTLEWHRQSELARYAQFLRELAGSVSQPADREQHLRAMQRAEMFGTDLVAKVAPDAARLLMRLSPAQVNEFLANLDERAAERAEDDLDAIAAGSWYAKRAKDTEKQLKRWTGQITAEQKLLLRQAARELQPTTAEWLASQSRWRAALGDALLSGDTPENVERRILELLHQPNTQWTPEYQAKSFQNREHFLRLVQALDASLVSAQRARLRRELNELAVQLEALTEARS